MDNKALRDRRGTTTEISTHTYPKGTLEVDTVKPSVVIHDGTTAGGVPLAQQVHSHANATESTPGFISAIDKTKLDALSSVGGYNTIEDDGTDLPQQSVLNFGPDLTAADDPTNSTTDVAISQAFRDEMSSDMIAFTIILS
jgi:hypothetical protein